MIDYKFREDELIKEFKRYIDSTYNGHYSTNRFQSTEVIIERGHGTGFCMGSIDKYTNRYGKKGTRDDARKDLMKILHYALLQLYIHDRSEEACDSDFDMSRLIEDSTCDINIADISYNYADSSHDGAPSISTISVGDIKI